MKPSIILEGYDGAGKTSLGRALSKKLGLPFYHAGPPAMGDDHALNCMQEQIGRLSEGCIYDRVTPISRPCYQLGLQSSHLRHLAYGLKAMLDNSAIIWCRPNRYVFTLCDHDTDDHIADISNRKQQIIDNYSDLFKELPHVEFNYQTTDWTYMLQKLQR